MMEERSGENYSTAQYSSDNYDTYDKVQSDIQQVLYHRGG